MIPEDWGVFAIQDLIDNSSIVGHLDGNHGALYPQSHEFKEFGVPYITANDLRGHSVSLKNCKFLSEERARRFRKGISKSGDVLFAHNATVGPTGLLSTELEYVILSTTATYFRCNPEKLHNYFLLYAIQSSFFVHQYQTVMSQSTRNQVPISAQRKLVIVVPPTKAEQEAIAESLSDADALIESLEQLIAKKHHLKQGAMQELLTGTRRLPGFANAKIGYKQTEAGMIPEDWSSTTIGNIATKVGSGITPHGGSDNYKEYGKPFVRSQNVGWGILLLSDLVYIDDETHNTFPTTELKSGDVLLNITGASIGRSAMADACLVGGNVNQHVCIIRADPTLVISRLINYFLLSAFGQRQIDSFQAGGNREGLNFGQIRSLKLPLPTNLSEQTTIVETLTDMDSEIAAQEAKLTKARQIKQGMMQELLTGRIRLV
ncbi:MAG: restriction endonuclease subunit S [Candidatus Ozemobacteraceae bacterium]